MGGEDIGELRQDLTRNVQPLISDPRQQCLHCIFNGARRSAVQLPAAGPDEQMHAPAIACVRTSLDQRSPFKTPEHAGECTRMEPQQTRQLFG